jgi:indolepyruvate ferredoxin oxidoreductase alpha subunit
VVFGELKPREKKAFFKHSGFILDPLEGPMASLPVPYRHEKQQEKLKQATTWFEESPFNSYRGPETPEILLITSSACHLYSKEAISLLGAADRVGLLKLGTTWPLPPRLVEKYLGITDKILIVEEVIPFLEENVKILAAELASKIGPKTFYGKREGDVPTTNEMNPDLVAAAVSKILKMGYEAVPEAYVNFPELLAAT